MKSAKMFLSTGVALAIALCSSVQLSGMERKKVHVSHIDELDARINALIDLLGEKGIIDVKDFLLTSVQEVLRIKGIINRGEYGRYSK